MIADQSSVQASALKRLQEEYLTYQRQQQEIAARREAELRAYERAMLDSDYHRAMPEFGAAMDALSGAPWYRSLTERRKIPLDNLSTLYGLKAAHMKEQATDNAKLLETVLERMAPKSQGSNFHFMQTADGRVIANNQLNGQSVTLSADDSRLFNKLLDNEQQVLKKDYEEGRITYEEFQSMAWTNARRKLDGMGDIRNYGGMEDRSRGTIPPTAVPPTAVPSATEPATAPATEPVSPEQVSLAQVALANAKRNPPPTATIGGPAVFTQAVPNQEAAQRQQAILGEELAALEQGDVPTLPPEEEAKIEARNLEAIDRELAIQKRNRAPEGVIQALEAERERVSMDADVGTLPIPGISDKGKKIPVEPIPQEMMAPPSASTRSMTPSASSTARLIPNPEYEEAVANRKNIAQWFDLTKQHTQALNEYNDAFRNDRQDLLPELAARRDSLEQSLRELHPKLKEDTFPRPYLEEEVPAAPQDVPQDVSTVPPQPLAGEPVQVAQSTGVPQFVGPSRRMTPLQIEQEKTDMADYSKLYKEQQEKLSSTNQMLASLNNMDAVNAREVVSGPLAKPWEFAGSVAAYFDPSSSLAQYAKNSQLYYSEMMNLVRDKIKALGAGTAVSNLDLLVTQKSVGDLSQTVEGRAYIIGVMRAIALAEQEILTEKARAYETTRKIPATVGRDVPIVSLQPVLTQRQKGSPIVRYEPVQYSKWSTQMQQLNPNITEKQIKDVWRLYSDPKNMAFLEENARKGFTVNQSLSMLMDSRRSKK